MNTPSFCDATSAVAITRYTKPAKTKRAFFLTATAIFLSTGAFAAISLWSQYAITF